MADGEGDGGSEQALLETVLKAIKDMERNTSSANQQLKKAFEDKLDGFRKEIADKQEAACAKLSQKMKKDCLQFKQKGNELQHAFNEEVKGKFEELVDLLSKGGDGIKRAKEVVKDGMELLENQQKLICIAGRSDMGWKTADEYENGPVQRTATMRKE